MKLDPNNFFRYFIFNPRSDELERPDKRLATIATLALGIGTLGICHAICYFFFYDRTFTKAPQDVTTKKTEITAAQVLSEKPKPIAMPTPIATEKPKPKKPNDYVLDFYRGSGKDIEGRTLETILAFSLEKKESAHDYIQWLFPSDASSRYNARAPVLDQALIAKMKQDPQITNNMKRAFSSMLEFYGLGYDEKKQEVYRLDSFDTRAKVWLTSGNHNFLRISRILHSLNLMGLHMEAEAFYNCLSKIKDDYPVCKSSFSYWTSDAQL